MEALADSRYVTELRVLHLGGGVTAKSVRKFVDSPNCARIRELRLGVSDLEGSLRAVAAGSTCGKLTTLIVEPAYMRPGRKRKQDGDAAGELARSKGLPNLSFLRYAGPMSRESTAALLDAEHIAWPGVVADGIRKVDLRQWFESRFGADATGWAFE